MIYFSSGTAIPVVPTAVVVEEEWPVPGTRTRGRRTEAGTLRRRRSGVRVATEDLRPRTRLTPDKLGPRIIAGMPEDRHPTGLGNFSHLQPLFPPHLRKSVASMITE